MQLEAGAFAPRPLGGADGGAGGGGVEALHAAEGERLPSGGHQAVEGDLAARACVVGWAGEVAERRCGGSRRGELRAGLSRWGNDSFPRTRQGVVSVQAWRSHIEMCAGRQSEDSPHPGLEVRQPHGSRLYGNPVRLYGREGDWEVRVERGTARLTRRQRRDGPHTPPSSALAGFGLPLHNIASGFDVIVCLGLWYYLPSSAPPGPGR